MSQLQTHNNKLYTNYWYKKFAFTENELHLLKKYQELSKTYAQSHTTNYVWAHICNKKINTAKPIATKMNNIEKEFYKIFDTFWSEERAALLSLKKDLRTLFEIHQKHVTKYFDQISVFMNIDPDVLYAQKTIVLMPDNRYGTRAQSNEQCHTHILATRPTCTIHTPDIFASIIHEATHIAEFNSKLRTLFKKPCTDFIKNAPKHIMQNTHNPSTDEVIYVFIETLITALSSADPTYFKTHILKSLTKQDKKIQQKLLQRKYSDNPAWWQYHMHAVAFLLVPLMKKYMHYGKQIDEVFINKYIALWREYILR